MFSVVGKRFCFSTHTIDACSPFVLRVKFLKKKMSLFLRSAQLECLCTSPSSWLHLEVSIKPVWSHLTPTGMKCLGGFLDFRAFHFDLKKLKWDSGHPWVTFAIFDSRVPRFLFFNRINQFCLLFFFFSPIACFWLMNVYYIMYSCLKNRRLHIFSKCPPPKKGLINQSIYLFLNLTSSARSSI